MHAFTHLLQSFVKLLHFLLLVGYGHQLVGPVPPEREGERQSLVDIVLQFLVELGCPTALDVLLEFVTGFESLSVARSRPELVQ